MTNEWHSHEVAKKEMAVQLIQRWLPVLPYRSIWAAIWSLRDAPYVGQDRAVTWIREYSKAIQVSPMQYCHEVQYICHEHVDIQCTHLPQGADVVPGELVLLESQHSPSENSIYLYTGEGGPLIEGET